MNVLFCVIPAPVFTRINSGGNPVQELRKRHELNASVILEKQELD
jgi:hypothetical protein